MDRKRRLWVWIALALALLLILLLAWCRDTGWGERVGSPETPEVRTLYPGASFELTVAPAPGQTLNAEHGDIVSLDEPPALVYVAPLTGDNDTYRVSDGSFNNTLAEGRVVIPMPPPAELSNVLVEGGRGIEAFYGDVQVSASLIDGVTTARYDAGKEADSLEIHLVDNDGEITWNG